MDIERKRLVMGILLIFFMISSVFGVLFFGFNQGTTNLNYNDFKFKQIQGQWGTTLNKQKILFEYHPIDVESLIIDTPTKSIITNSKMIYLTSDFNDTDKESIAQSSFQLTQRFNEQNVFVVNAFTQETQYNTPIITCENASNTIPVLFFQSAENTSITNINNCIILEASTQYAFGRLRDRILYMLYGVIE
tara:strand:+ start:2409 stop:2981 length:573 start_codon:yes stop_codon:yes gene_type:complete